MLKHPWLLQSNCAKTVPVCEVFLFVFKQWPWLTDTLGLEKVIWSMTK